MTQLLRDVIHVLTRPHLRRTTNTEGETIYGEEPALLDILEDCVASTTGSKAGVSPFAAATAAMARSSSSTCHETPSTTR